MRRKSREHKELMVKEGRIGKISKKKKWKCKEKHHTVPSRRFKGSNST